MYNIQDFYILGLPIDTEIGQADFIKVRDYPQYYVDLQIIGMSKNEIIYKYSQINKNGQYDEMIAELKKSSFYEICTNLPELKQSYYNVFMKAFGRESTVSLIGEDNFDIYRDLVMKMNCVTEEEYNPNPEIQKHIERSKRVKSMDQEKLTFEAMCTSIVAQSGVNYKDILEWTIYEFYATFYRTGQMKMYDTSTLFATVSSEKINIENWSKHIDMFEKEKHFITEKEFKSKTAKVVKD